MVLPGLLAGISPVASIIIFIHITADQELMSKDANLGTHLTCNDNT